jgi:RNA polymerase sigma factor (sigma-70 family)
MNHKNLGKTARYPIDYYNNDSLRDRRLSFDYSIKTLAILVGVSSPTINAYERLRAYPSEGVEVKIAEVLKCDREEIFSENIRKLTRALYYVRRKKIIAGKKRFDDALNHSIPLNEGHKEELFYYPRDIRLFDEDNLIRQKIINALGTLDETKLFILKYRFGLFDGKEYSLKEVGDMLGCSKENIRTHQNRALSQLKPLLEDLSPY